MTTYLDALTQIRIEIAATLIAIEKFDPERYPPGTRLLWGQAQKCGLAMVDNSIRFKPADVTLVDSMIHGPIHSIETIRHRWNRLHADDPTRTVDMITVSAFVASVYAECIATRTMCDRLSWTGAHAHG